MKKIIACGSLLLFCVFTLNAQKYYSGKLVLNNGVIKEGFVQVPKTAAQKKTNFKESLDSKVEKINSDDVFSLFLKVNNQNMEFHRTYFKIIYGSIGKEKEKLFKKKGWFYLNSTHKTMNCYIGGQQYKLNKKGELKIISSGLHGAQVNYYFKRPNEKEITMISEYVSGAVILNLEKSFKVAANSYFKGSKKLLNKINNEEFKSIDVMSIYDHYIAENK